MDEELARFGMRLVELRTALDLSLTQLGLGLIRGERNRTHLQIVRSQAEQLRHLADLIDEKIMRAGKGSSLT